MLPVQIVLRHIPNSSAIENHIKQKAAKIETLYERINRIHVVVDLPKKHLHQGKLYNVSIDMNLPKKKLVVNRKYNADIYIAIRDAFLALERQLDGFLRRRRGDVKFHQVPQLGYIKRIFTEENYGFIHGLDGTEYYFSNTNISHPSFEQLCVGDQVSFISFGVADGPQAHHIVLEKNVK